MKVAVNEIPYLVTQSTASSEGDSWDGLGMPVTMIKKKEVAGGDGVYDISNALCRNKRKSPLPPLILFVPRSNIGASLFRLATRAELTPDHVIPTVNQGLRERSDVVFLGVKVDLSNLLL